MTKPTDVDIRIGAKLREARMYRNVPIGHMAERMGMSKVNLHYLETGKTAPKARHVAAAARLLRISPTFFFEGVDC